jgi:hypothetical protein
MGHQPERPAAGDNPSVDAHADCPAPIHLTLFDNVERRTGPATYLVAHFG